jgi:crotonobetainyl-CoA:carnitine CoA-transferase CaiB-like acyl-CoA transferase
MILGDMGAEVLKIEKPGRHHSSLALYDELALV